MSGRPVSLDPWSTRVEAARSKVPALSDRLSPHAQYDQHAAHCAQAVSALERRDVWVANARLAVFIAGIAAVTGWWLGSISSAWAWACAAAFFVLVVMHERTVQAKARIERVAHYFRDGKRRLDDQWQGHGNAGEHLIDEDHLYAADLDLFGGGSLFELLCTARTRAGERALGQWLTQAADRPTIERRQAAVIELRERLELRRDLAVAGGDVQAELSPVAVTQWGRGAAAVAPRLRQLLLVGAWMVPAFAVASCVGWALDMVSPWPFVAALLFTGLIGRVNKERIHHILGAVLRPARELEVFARLLHRLQAERFSSPYAEALAQRLFHGDHSAAHAIDGLQRLFAWHQMSHNQIFAPIGFVLWWNFHFALAIERWRVRHGHTIGDWLVALGEFEALCSLATYAFEHPDDIFPEVVDGSPMVVGEDLGHPLMPGDTCVRNSVELGPEIRLLLISGSNMSGKSTYLRTIGINVVLALAGAPVRARSLRVTPMFIGATLRIQDSLQRGRSRFFAEITRLRDILEAARQGPLLFLLDEMLHGTNSHDRGIGAAAILRGLLDIGAIGAATTHDLALADLAKSLAGARNVHFADTFVDGELTFDYRRREGVVKDSNAVALMRSIGLHV